MPPVRQQSGASRKRDRAGRPADQAPAGLGDTATIPSAASCHTCRYWDTRKSDRPFHVTTVDLQQPRNGYGICRRADNYTWGKRDPERRRRPDAAKMMPCDWTGYNAVLFTAPDHVCGEYAQAIEARRAETPQDGSVHESAVPQECAQGGPDATS